MTTHNDRDLLDYFKLAKENEKLRQELERIKGTLSWQAYEAIDRSTLGPILRQFMKVVGAPIRRRLARKRKPTASHQPPINHTDKFMPSQETWLAAMRQQQPDAIAVLHPEWWGIRSSTTTLFSACYYADDSFDDKNKARTVARLLAETKCPRIVYSGLAISHCHIIEALYRIAPQVKQYVLWHGNFYQMEEDYSWGRYKIISGLCRSGRIHKWGFVKKGMAEIMAKTGLNTGFVMNYVKDIPAGPSTPLPDGPHLGVWGLELLWHKMRYASLASSVMIPGAKLYGPHVKQRLAEFGKLMGVTWSDYNQDWLPQEQMPHKLSQMTLNLYVTLVECMPMLPLESLSVGVPCLVAPNSHIFEDHDYLKKMLIVTYYDNAYAIAEAAQRAIEHRAEIVQAYIDYAPDYNQRAIESLATFLDMR